MFTAAINFLARRRDVLALLIAFAFSIVLTTLGIVGGLFISIFFYIFFCFLLSFVVSLVTNQNTIPTAIASGFIFFLTYAIVQYLYFYFAYPETGELAYWQAHGMFESSQNYFRKDWLLNFGISLISALIISVPFSLSREEE